MNPHHINLSGPHIGATPSFFAFAIMLLSPLWHRLATAAAVPPTAQGVLAVVKALGGMSLCCGVSVCLGAGDVFMRVPHDREDLPSLPTLTTTLARSLIFPSLLEEVFWRVWCQPPGMSWPTAAAVNLAFSAYHVVGSTFLAERLDGRQGARAVFHNPTFLSLAFWMGNACSFAYVQSGHALWAPVVLHALVVTVWLTVLGGDAALSTPGGLPPRIL